jgi:acetyl esterase/lipase
MTLHVMCGLAVLATMLLVACAPDERVPGNTPANSTPTGVQLDVPYLVVGGRTLRLDVHVPKSASVPVPVVVNFHGGGWVAGTKGGLSADLQRYLAAGWAVVMPEYRLAPADLAPAAVEDAVCAMRWVAEQSRRLGLDTTRIVVAGYSAGGHLALMVGVLAGSDAFGDNCPGRVTPQPAAVVSLAGVSNVAALIAGDAMRDWAVAWIGSTPARDSIARRVSPLFHVRRNMPPVMSVHGLLDGTVPHTQAERLHQVLDEAGVPNRLLTLATGDHEGLFEREDVRRMILTAIMDFLRTHHVVAREL